MTRLRDSRLTPGPLLVSLLGVAVLAVVALPVEVAGTLDVPGRVLPAREWAVVRGTDGAVSATLRDHRTGRVEATFVAAPERGDATHFHLDVGASAWIAAGDTVGAFVSGEAAVRASRLAGDIEAAEAQVTFFEAGQKDALVEAARQEVVRAEEARDQAQRDADRLADLFARDVVAAQDVEAAQSEVQRATAEAAGAAARLDDVQTGRRDEEVRLARARRAALEREADALRDRLGMNTLVAPISGVVHRVVSPDTLLVVADTSAYTVVLPVRWGDRARAQPGQTVRVRGAEWGPAAEARIVDLRETSARADGQTYLLATAEIVRGAETLTPGLLVLCTVETPPAPLTERLRRFWTDRLSG
ncbi:MAG: hypothetical protein AAF594_00895 [Bacteroidota bacterium]